MEKMLSEFRTFGESLSDVRERVSRIEPDLHAVKEDVAVLKSVVQNHSQDLHAIKSGVATLKSDVATLKSDVAEIKGDFKNYHQRLGVMEAKLVS